MSEWLESIAWYDVILGAGAAGFCMAVICAWIVIGTESQVRALHVDVDVLIYRLRNHLEEHRDAGCDAIEPDGVCRGCNDYPREH